MSRFYEPAMDRKTRLSIIKQLSQPPGRSESIVENALVEFLEAAGHNPQQQVECKAGRADVVTDKAVIEVEAYLSRDSLFHAVGQALLYRQAIDPKLQAWIVGRRFAKDDALVRKAERIGICAYFWDDGLIPALLVWAEENAEALGRNYARVLTRIRRAIAACRRAGKKPASRRGSGS